MDEWWAFRCLAAYFSQFPGIVLSERERECVFGLRSSLGIVAVFVYTTSMPPSFANWWESVEWSGICVNVRARMRIVFRILPKNDTKRCEEESIQTASKRSEMEKRKAKNRTPNERENTFILLTPKPNAIASKPKHRRASNPETIAVVCRFARTAHWNGCYFICTSCHW